MDVDGHTHEENEDSQVKADDCRGISTYAVLTMYHAQSEGLRQAIPYAV